MRNTTTTYMPSTTVVQNGIYAYSRNPMYVGFVLILLALAVLLDSMSAYIFPVLLFGILNWKFIPFEEKKMETELGQEYLKYKNKVRRWL